MEFLRRCYGKMSRVKTIPEDIHQTSLSRCLTTFDLTLLGIGHMIGAGLYVLSGTVIKEMAGPSAVLSFCFAGVAAFLSALCYAEFGARIPKAGSAYSYTYVTIGELWGFLIGWNIILEHIVGVASVARAWSGALDAIFDGAIRNGTIRVFGHLAEDSEWISAYPDLVATGIVIVAFVLVATGAKASVHFNSIFTILNVLVLAFIIITGFVFADSDYWMSEKYGGFFPYGFTGTISGAATCFFAFIGFEGIAIGGEEAKHPEKSIPIASAVALTVVTCLYILATSSLTLMIPYYKTFTAAAYPVAFAQVGASWAKYVVGAGTMLGITTSLIGGAFSLPRAVYAMAEDGLLFRFLAFVHPRTQTPVNSILVFGAISLLMALMFEITTLVEFMSIGTLFGYTIVAASIIILRYQPVEKCQFKLRPDGSPAKSISTKSIPDATDEESEKQSILSRSKSHDDFGRLRQTLREFPILKNFQPGNGVKSAVICMMASIAALMLVLIDGFNSFQAGAWWSVLLFIIFSIFIVVFYLIIIAHEQNDAFLTFQVPFVPLLPSLSILINTGLMISLSKLTWLRLVIWIAVGLVLYFVYGMHFSRENRPTNGYGQIVEYSGDAKLPTNAMSSLSGEVKEQQPADKMEDSRLRTAHTPPLQ